MFDLSIVLSKVSVASWWRAKTPAESVAPRSCDGRVAGDGEDRSSLAFSAAVAGLGHPLAAG